MTGKKGGEDYIEENTILGIMAENDQLFIELPPIHTLVEADISWAAEFFFEALCCATREAALKQQSAIYKYKVAWQKTKNGEIFKLKQDYLNNQLEIFQKERELSQFLDHKLKKELENYQKFECLNSEKITPHFINLVKSKAKEASLDDIVDFGILSTVTPGKNSSALPLKLCTSHLTMSN